MNKKERKHLKANLRFLQLSIVIINQIEKDAPNIITAWIRYKSWIRQSIIEIKEELKDGS